MSTVKVLSDSTGMNGRGVNPYFQKHVKLAHAEFESTVKTYPFTKQVDGGVVVQCREVKQVKGLNQNRWLTLSQNESEQSYYGNKMHFETRTAYSPIEQSKEEKKDIETDNLKNFIKYIKPFLHKACEGGFSGHNFNSYLPKNINDNIPMEFRDLVSTIISSLAKKTATTSTSMNSGRVTNNFMPLRYFDFLEDEELKTIPSGFETYYYPWMLYQALKCIQLYLKS